LVEQGGRRLGVGVSFARHDGRDNHLVIGRDERRFGGSHPVAERGPEEICVVVFVPSLQRKRGYSTVGWRTVLPLDHSGVQERLSSLKDSSEQVVRREATRRVAGKRVH